MKKIIILISGLITLTLTLVLVAVLYLVNIDPNEHKSWIAEKFFEQTGRELSLEGNIGLTFYPWLGIELNEVTVSNAPGFSDTPFLTTERALVRIKLMPMLDQQYEIDTVLLLGSNIHLEVDNSGLSNWASLITEPDNSDESSDTNEPLPLNNIALGGVDIQNANLTFNDFYNDQHYDINQFTMSTSELVYGEPIQLNIDFTIRSSRPELSAQADFTGTVIYDLDQQQYQLSPLSLNSLISGPNIPNGSTTLTLNTALNIDLANDTLSLSNLEFSALGTQIAANINAQNFQTATPSFQAGLNMVGQDLALLFRVAEVTDLANQIENINNREFDFSAAIESNLQTGQLSLSGLKANLLGASISGDIDAANIQSTAPSINAQLNANGPNLPALLEVAGQIQGGSDASLSQYGQQLSRISNKSFSIDASVDADLAKGNINAPTFNAELLGFTVNGQLTAQDMNDATGRINGSLQLANNNLKEVLAALDQTDLANIAQSLNLSVGLEGNRNNLSIAPLNLNLVLSGAQIPNSPIDLKILAQSNISLDNDTLQVSNFTIDGLGLDINGSLNANNLSQQTTFNGNLNIASFNLRQLLKQLNQDIPATSDATTLQSISAGAIFSGSPTNLQLSEMTFTLDDSEINGNLSLTDFNDPAIEFSMNIDQINADRYLAPTAETNNNNAESNSALPVDSLEALKIKGDVSITQLEISGLNIANLVMGINANDGLIELSPMQADLYEGSYTGDIALDVSKDTPLANMNLAFNSVTLEPLMNDFMDASYVSGVGNIDFSISGSGADTATIKRNLNGNGNIALVDGILQGVDIGSVLNQVETMIRSQRVIDIQRGESTPFNNVTASIVMNNGNISSNDLLIQAPGFQVSGRGSLVNLNDHSINYNLLATVNESTATSNDEEYDIGGYTLPIACTGTINSPRCLPDVQEIIASALKKAVSDGLSNLIQRTLGVDSPSTPSSEQTTDNENSQEQAPEAEPESIEEQLINRALDSLFR